MRKPRQKWVIIEWAYDEPDQHVPAVKLKLEMKRRKLPTEGKGGIVAKFEAISKLFMDGFSRVGPEKFGRSIFELLSGRPYSGCISLIAQEFIP
jgi:hypothetical protein